MRNSVVCFVFLSIADLLVSFYQSLIFLVARLQATIMRAFSLSTMKKHPSLIPLVFMIAAGMTMCSAYVFRLATKSPEVSWNKKGNPEPWNDYDKKQYKFYNPGRDYSATPDRPKF